MALAETEFSFTLKPFREFQIGIVKWPMTVLRIRSSKKKKLVEVADYILEKWKRYSDPSVDILSQTEGTPHNTITPIVRKRKSEFEMDLVLRYHRTNEEHPLGIFHPHADVHHIKKENIGLIEVMGLAALPGRLENELKEVGNYLLNEPHQIPEYHVPWAEELNEKYGMKNDRKQVEKIIQQEIGKKFLKVLTDASVFKRDEQGRQALTRFIRYLNQG